MLTVPLPSSSLTPSIITLIVGKEQRIFAAHQDVLNASPWFQQALSEQYMDSNNRRIYLPDDEPEIFSSVLEYLYKGDYYPRLVHNKKRNSWEIEQLEEERGASETTIYHHGSDGDILKDTIIYCAAERYGLEELKKVALRKQGLRKSYGYPPSTLKQAINTSVQNLASNAAPSSPQHATHIPTLPIQTRSSAPTTSP